jgi:hypothetical protein
MLSGESFMTGNELEKFDEGVIRDRIYSIRGFQVMLDRDLAELYGVETKILNKAVKRNSARFPAEFMMKLTQAEYECISNLRFPNGTSSWGVQDIYPLSLQNRLLNC